jgi:hypothetical protein
MGSALLLMIDSLAADRTKLDEIALVAVRVRPMIGWHTYAYRTYENMYEHECGTILNLTPKSLGTLSASSFHEYFVIPQS